MKLGLYPGCSLEGLENSYLVSLVKSFEALGINLEEIKDWNCCGATAIPSINVEFSYLLVARNLALAENSGLNIVITPCSECYNRLAYVNYKIKNDEAFKNRINNYLKEIGLRYDGNVEVKHPVDFLVKSFGIDKIKQKVKKPINKRVASYYGCLFVRPREISIESAENPRTMDQIVEAIGGKPVNYGFKTKCCGASIIITRSDAALKLIRNILKSCKDNGAELIVTSCPLCHSNLDMQQEIVVKTFNEDIKIPVLYFTQLLGLSLGLNEKDLALDKNLTYEMIKL